MSRRREISRDAYAADRENRGRGDGPTPREPWRKPDAGGSSRSKSRIDREDEDDRPSIPRKPLQKRRPPQVADNRPSIPRRPQQTTPLQSRRPSAEDYRHPDEESKSVFLHNMPYTVDWRQIKDLCRSFGLFVKHVELKTDPITKVSKGCAVVEFSKRDEVRRAISKLSELEFEGRPLGIQEHRGGTTNSSSSASSGHEKYHDAGSKWTGKRDQGHQKDTGGWGYSTSSSKWQGSRSGFPDDDAPPPPPPDFRKTGPVAPPPPDRRREKAALPPPAAQRKRPIGSGEVCVYFLQGRCAYGEKCRKVHDPSAATSDEVPKSKSQETDGTSKRDRRLFCEHLAPDVTWKELKDFFKVQFRVLFADVISASDEEYYGVVEFASREDALEACMAFNGVLLNEQPLRLRQDRGEFEELRTNKRRRQRDQEPPEAEDDYYPPPKARKIDAKEASQNNDEDEECCEELEEELFRDSGSEDKRDLEEADYAEDRDEYSRYEDEEFEVQDQKDRSDDEYSATKVYVGNLSFRLQWQELKDHMRQAGEVKFCTILKDEDGKSKGCGFVEYHHEHEVEDALEGLNGTKLLDREIYVKRTKAGNRHSEP